MKDMLFLYFIIFLFGISVGSFLNSIIYRLQTKESFLFKRSYCPHCQHKLSWQDLIPLFSFLILKGKCRHCSQKISWQYPLVELATGVLFALILYLAAHNLLLTIYQLVIACFLIIIFVYDLKHYIISDKVIYPLLFLALIYNIFSFFIFHFSPKETIIYPLVSATISGIFFLSIVLLSRGKWLGLGDVKLAFFMGLFLGFPNILVALFLAFLIGAIVGVGLIVTGKKTLKSEVPFGPFLVTGTFVAMFWGGNLISWYLNLFCI